MRLRFRSVLWQDATRAPAGSSGGCGHVIIEVKGVKTFISASGRRGRALAHAVASLLTDVVSPLEPWFHESDVPKGVLWAQELWDKLKDPQLGVVCVTRESRSAPWLLFEAGMLAHNLGGARVFTLLLDLDASEVGEPLAHFQATQLANEEDVLSLMLCLNACNDARLDPGDITQRFQNAWSRFQDAVRALPTAVEARPSEGTEALLRAVLGRVESLERYAGTQAIEQLDYNEGSPGLTDEALRGCVVACLDKLPEKERLVLSFYYREALSMRDIGHILEMTESRVAQIHTKGVLRVRAMTNVR
jgi:RNA polymerase sigma factor (sigma-70 family)